MPKVRVGDITMNYVEAGEGEPLLLIMGYGGDHLAWGFQIPAFTERYRVIAFDNRGAGQSDTPDHPYTIGMMAEDARGLLDALGIDRAHVIGVSMGGMIAQELALNHPGRLRSLHLGCSLARPDAYLQALLVSWREIRTRFDRETSLRMLSLWLFSAETYDERPEFVDAILQSALAHPYPQSLTGFLRQGEAVAGHDTVERLINLRCPTLVSVAEGDILVPPRFSRQLASLIPGAVLRIVPGAGHVYFWEQAEAFNTLCLEFLTTSRG